MIISDQKKEQLRDTNSYLLILFSFFIPTSVGATNITGAIIILLWLVIGTFKDDWNQLKNNKVVLAILLYVVIHIIGLLWTNSLESGFDMIKKDIRLLLIPIFMLFIKKEHIEYYIYAFLAAMTLSEILSYGIYFEIIPPFKYASIYDPTPFLHHTAYNPLLTMAIYILLYYTLLSKTLNKKQKIIYSTFIVTMSINMFITGGRAGQVMYFAMFVLLFFQYYEKQRVKAFFLSVIIIPLIFIVSYNSSTIFKDRINQAITNISKFETNKDTSIGNRINQLFNSIEIIKENPVVGVGTGGFVKAYREVHLKLTPEASTRYIRHPHNMYILEYVELGIFGLLSLILILLSQITHAIQSDDKLKKNLGLAIPLLFALIMLSDTYLSTPATTVFFVLFSSFLYKNYNLNKV